MEEREISKLKANPQNPRGAVNRDAKFYELVASIKVSGVLQSVLITPNDLIVAGHRRVEAAEEAGLKTVPVIVKKMSQIEQLEAMLAENLQREDLNVLQEGAAYAILTEHGLTISQIAKAIGVSGTRVGECIALLKLCPDVQRHFAWGILPLSCVSPLVDLKTAEEQVHWGAQAVKKKYTGTALKNAIDCEGQVPRRVPQLTTAQVASNSIAKLRIIDEAIDYHRQLASVQPLLRQAVRLLQEAMKIRAA